MAGQLQLKFVNFPKGSYIIIEGKQNADRFFIIRNGKVGISKEVEVVEEQRGNILGPGDFFGVVATMSSHSHIETALALTDVSLISVQKDQYSQLIQQNSPVAMKIILQFSKRMRYLDEALTTITLKHSGENDASQLFKVGEYYARKNQYPLAFYAYNQYLKYCPSGGDASTARMRMLKIARYAKGVKLSFDSGDSVRNYERDNMIFSEGEWGDELYIIETGSVKIAKIVDNNEVLLALLGPGDIFGEMALLESKPRAACAIAHGDCRLTVVNRANFEQMIVSEPQLIARLTILLSERIYYIYKQLANTLIKDPLGRMYDLLLTQMEKNRLSPQYNGSYCFEFGPEELVNMIGLSREQGPAAMEKLMENRVFKLLNGKLYVSNCLEIARQASFYKKMDQRLLSRQGSLARAGL
jgi:CRP-like cAMP-binding protein